jgi:integrase
MLGVLPIKADGPAFVFGSEGMGSMAKRSSRAEGTIYKRKDGRWCVHAVVDGHRLTHTARTKRQCVSWVEQFRGNTDGTPHSPADPSTLGGFLEDWLTKAKPYLRPKTWSQYSQVVRQYVSPYLGDYGLDEVGPGDIQELYGKLLSQGRSLFTLRITHAVLHRALRQAVRWGILDRNPCDGVDKPKPRRREMQTLTAGQVRRLLEAVEGTQFEALYYLAVTTGLRQGELLGLKWSDVDWSVPCLKVQRQLQRIAGQGLVFAEPKTTAGRRVVVLGPSAVEKMKQHLQRQSREREKSGKTRWQDYDLVFPSSRGTPMGPRNLLRHFKITLERAGLPNVRFHDLRHTAASLMLMQGTHPKVVQERLGHSQISVTLDTYSHVLPSLQAEAAEKIDELVEGDT